MLIPLNELEAFAPGLRHNVARVVHVGAHACEEADVYRDIANEVVWVDAAPKWPKVGNTEHVYLQSLIWSENHRNLDFHVANNGQSSSILPFGTHSKHHPNVVYEKTVGMESRTLDCLLFDLPAIKQPRVPTFLNLDIQGTEYEALLGANRLLQVTNYVYTEVNTEEVYEGCARLSDIVRLLLAYDMRLARHVMTPAGWGDAFFVRNNPVR